MISVDQLIARLEKPRQSSEQQWIACCPSHVDTTPSLSIRVADDGRILLHCFAGCPVREVVEALGLELSDLFPDSPSRGRNIRRPRLDGWVVIQAMRMRLAAVAIIAADMEAGKPLTEEGQKLLAECVDDIQRVIREAQRIK